MKPTALTVAALMFAGAAAHSAPNHHWPLDTNLQDVQGLNDGTAEFPGTHIPGPVLQSYTQRVTVSPWTDMQGGWAVSLWFKYAPPSDPNDTWTRIVTPGIGPGSQGVGISIVESAVTNSAPDLASSIGDLILVVASKQWLIPNDWQIEPDRWYHLSLSVDGTSFDARLRDAYGNEKAEVLVANELPVPVTSESEVWLGDEDGNIFIDDVRAWTSNAKAEADATYGLVQPRKRLVVEVAGSVDGPWDSATTVEIPVLGISDAEFFRIRFEDVEP